ncbi:hypothetical protein V5799_014158 [Amblyomma americanum]|uniref:Integrase catalytic domain-containing protein n=1 Tax=Amblyomma americanum TaxID=6943 RepID=A0AAQ4E3V0_AMBAM
MMETTLAGIPGVSVYLDDIIFRGKDTTEHAQRLDKVLSRVSEKGLRLRQAKCRFGIDSVGFLGHKIDAKGIHTTEEKVRAILQAPWQTAHADFAGPVEGRMLLIVVDAYSKWLEVRHMRNIQSPTVVEELRNLFATFGIPERLVTDNGPSFVSAEMEDFLKKNGIAHITSAPYHPATNGQAERMVFETKQALAKDQSGALSCRLARFLLKQHTIVSATTGRTPTALMFGRELSTALTRIQPRPAETATSEHSVTNSPRGVAVGQKIFFRNFTGSPVWIEGTVLERLGHRSWLIKSGTETVRRHLDHIKPGAEFHPTQDRSNEPTTKQLTWYCAGSVSNRATSGNCACARPAYSPT